jgi:predicted dehydrogenase
MHHPWTMKALAAGKHVLCEKPYSRHPDEVEEAFDAASAAGLVLAEAFMYRHHPQTATVRRLVADGELGRLCAVKATFSFPLRDLSDVRALPELDGGALMDVGCYCVSGIRLLAGDPEHVRGEQVTGPTGVDMAFHGTLRCADDVVGQFEASFRSPQRQRLEAVGEDGVLVAEAPWRVDLGGSLTLTRDGATEVVEVETADAYTLELVNLADAIDGRAESLLGREDAVGQARTIDALYRSAETRAVATL